MAYRCKRIIDGKTYNTETATRLAGWEEETDGYPVTYGQHLYKNRFGAFFLYYYADDGPEGPEAGITPYTPDEARAWLEKYRSYDVDLFESIFGKAPEAGSKERKYTLRLPDTLHDRLSTRAKLNGQSLNAWIIRCLEHCSTDEDAANPSKERP